MTTQGNTEVKLTKAGLEIMAQRGVLRAARYFELEDALVSLQECLYECRICWICEFGGQAEWNRLVRQWTGLFCAERRQWKKDNKPSGRK